MTMALVVLLLGAVMLAAGWLMLRVAERDLNAARDLLTQRDAAAELTRMRAEEGL